MVSFGQTRKRLILGSSRLVKKGGVKKNRKNYEKEVGRKPGHQKNKALTRGGHNKNNHQGTDVLHQSEGGKVAKKRCYNPQGGWALTICDGGKFNGGNPETKNKEGKSVRITFGNLLISSKEGK